MEKLAADTMETIGVTVKDESSGGGREKRVVTKGNRCVTPLDWEWRQKKDAPIKCEISVLESNNNAHKMKTEPIYKGRKDQTGVWETELENMESDCMGPDMPQQCDVPKQCDHIQDKLQYGVTKR